jgi:hypothetical protein
MRLSARLIERGPARWQTAVRTEKRWASFYALVQVETEGDTVVVKLHLERDGGPASRASARCAYCRYTSASRMQTIVRQVHGEIEVMSRIAQDW